MAATISGGQLAGRIVAAFGPEGGPMVCPNCGESRVADELLAQQGLRTTCMGCGSTESAVSASARQQHMDVAREAAVMSVLRQRANEDDHLQRAIAAAELEAKR